MTLILIHGTHQSEIMWNSYRRNQILNAFCTDKYLTFRWSGKLSHRARKKAAWDLFAFLKGINDDIGLVGFSHGGNVILLFLSSLYSFCCLFSIDMPKKIKCLVTIGTPMMGFYKNKYKIKNGVYWLAISSDSDRKQWFASLFRRWSKRRTSPYADHTILKSGLKHRELLDNVKLWGDVKIHLKGIL